MRYHHLTLQCREKILLGIWENRSCAEIAMVVGCHKSTISRELARNGGRKQYRIHRAQKRYLKVRQSCRRTPKLVADKETAELIQTRIKEKRWSPEQIVGREGLEISVTTIYRGIRNGILPGKELKPYLRHRGNRRLSKEGERRGKITSAVSITERPQEAENRTRVGDWEGDTVMGKKGTGCVLTLVDRKTRLLVAGKLPGKHAQRLADKAIGLLRDKPCRTVTFDNGLEFARHQAISQALDTAIYFAHPRSPWERGTNENTNGLLRDFIPKGTDMRKVTESELKRYVELLNNRPRKCLEWRTPAEAFHEKLTCCT